MTPLPTKPSRFFIYDLLSVGSKPDAASTHGSDGHKPGKYWLIAIANRVRISAVFRIFGEL